MPISVSKARREIMFKVEKMKINLKEFGKFHNVNEKKQQFTWEIHDGIETQLTCHQPNTNRH